MVTDQDNEQNTPLHLAVENRSYEVAKLLIEKSESLSVAAFDSRVSLWWCSIFPSVNLELLRIQQKDQGLCISWYSGLSQPFHSAGWRGHFGIATEGWNGKSNPTPLSPAVFDLYASRWIFATVCFGGSVRSSRDFDFGTVRCSRKSFLKAAFDLRGGLSLGAFYFRVSFLFPVNSKGRLTRTLAKSVFVPQSFPPALILLRACIASGKILSVKTLMETVLLWQQWRSWVEVRVRTPH